MFSDKAKKSHRGSVIKPRRSAKKNGNKHGASASHIKYGSSTKKNSNKRGTSNLSSRSSKAIGSRGATSAAIRNWGFAKLFWLFRTVFFVGVFVFVGMNVDWLTYWHQVKGLANKPLANITINGEFNYLKKDDIRQLLEKQIDGNFVDTDLKFIKGSIENHPWVERAALRRIWPDQMVIDVTEQKPIARWGDEGFINQYGEIINIVDNRQLSHLPILFGAEGNSREITNTYLGVAEALSGKGLVLTGIQVDPTLSWEVVLNKDFLVVLGREDILLRLRKFLDIYEKQMGEEKNKIKRVDMRYDSGMAVEWKEDEGQWAQLSAK